MLDRLPLELLQQILQEADLPPFRSLTAVTLVCRTTYRAACPLLFRRVKLDVRDSAKLKDDVDELSGILSRTSTLENVQCLELRGHMRLGFNPADVETKIEVFQETAMDPEEMEQLHGIHDVVWRSIIRFMRLLPQLSDLIFNCRTRFPLILLDSLPKLENPNLRVHIKYFRYGRGALSSPFTQATKLVASPYIHSFPINAIRPRGPSEQDFYSEFLHALNPSINQIHLFCQRIAPWCQPSPTYTVHGDVYSSWPLANTDGDGRKVSEDGIRFLTVHSVESISEHQLRKFRESIDMSSLQSLRFVGSHGRLETFGLECLKELQNWHLPALTCLELTFPWIRNRLYPDQYWELCTTFIQSVPPVQDFRVHGGFSRGTFNTILTRHGNALRRLSLLPNLQCANSIPPKAFTLGYDEVLDICTICPLVEDLKLVVPRTQGDQEEVAIYRALGSFPSLRSLALILDAKVDAIPRREHDYESIAVAPEVDSLDSFYQQVCKELHLTTERIRALTSGFENTSPRYGHIFKAFINAAVDEKLARNIFHTILKERVGVYTLLETLEISTINLLCFGESDIDVGLSRHSRPTATAPVPHTDYGISDLGYIQRAFACHFFLQRRWVKGESDNIIVLDLSTSGSHTSETDALPREFQEVFQRIWPTWGKRDCEWRTVWHSLPLQI